MKKGILLAFAVALLTLLAPGRAAQATTSIAIGLNHIQTLVEGVSNNQIGVASQPSWLGFNEGRFSELGEISAGLDFQTNQNDGDNDGVGDSDDECPDTAPSVPVDGEGCSDEQVDGDGDGVCDPGAPSGGPSGCTGSDDCPDTPPSDLDVGSSGCTITPLGIVVIKKVIEPPGPQGNFTFNHTIDDSGPFTLSQGGSKTFNFIPIGPYTVTEQTPTGGFRFVEWQCLNRFGAVIGPPSSTPTATFEVKFNQTDTCIFTNRRVIDPGVAESVALEGRADVFVMIGAELWKDHPVDQPITEETIQMWREVEQEIIDNKLEELGEGFVLKERYKFVLRIRGTVIGGEALEKLKNNEHVMMVSLDEGEGSGHLADNVPLIDADQWLADGVTGEGVLVAVIDSGIDPNHADLADDLAFEECFGDNDGGINGIGFCPGGSDRRSGVGAAEDDESHGSHVTGIVTSKGTVSPVGVAPDAEIVAIKVLDGANNFYYFAEILAAVDFVIINKPVAGGFLDVKLVNMSLGTNARFDSDCDGSNAWNMAGASAVNLLRVLGVTVFASSGNDSSTTSMSSPACLSEVVSVGATDDFDNVAAFTNSNASTDMMAPGVGVVSTDNTGVTAIKSGTSMASPHAVGCAALLIEAGVVMTPAEVEARLKNSPVQVSVGTFSFPRIDCRIPSDRPSVGGLSSFASSSRSSSGRIALVAGGIAALVAVAATGAWYTRKRWLRS